MNWQQHLTDDERKRLAEIDQERKELTEERRRIYDRCRRRTVEIGPGVRIEVRAGIKFVIDAEDLAKIEGYNWNASCWTEGSDERFAPYIQGSRKGESRRRVYLHRLLMDAPQGMVVHHRDGNPLNNRRSNLEVVTQATNAKIAGEHAKMRNGV